MDSMMLTTGVCHSRQPKLPSYDDFVILVSLLCNLTVLICLSPAIQSFALPRTRGLMEISGAVLNHWHTRN